MSVEHRGTKALELWTRRATEGYPGVNISNMTTSWRDGLAFCALIHHFRPELIDFKSLKSENILENNALAFRVAEQHLGIPALLDAEDMVQTAIPDRLSILTYVSQFYQAFSALGLIGPGGRRSPLSTNNTNKKSSSPPSTPTKPAPFVSPPKAQPISQPPATLQTKTEPGFKTDKVTVGVRVRREECVACHKTVFLAERIVVGFPGQLRHRTCFRCDRCATQLTLASYYETEKGQFCCETCPDEERSLSSGEEDSTTQGRAKLSRSSDKGESSSDSESDSDSTGSSDSEKDSPISTGLSPREDNTSPQPPTLRKSFLHKTLESSPAIPDTAPPVKPPRISDAQLTPPTNFSRLSPALCGNDFLPPTESLDSDFSGHIRCDDAKGQETCPPGNALDTGQKLQQPDIEHVSSNLNKPKQNSPFKDEALEPKTGKEITNDRDEKERKVSQLKKVFELNDKETTHTRKELEEVQKSIQSISIESPIKLSEDKDKALKEDKEPLKTGYKYSPVYKRKSSLDAELKPPKNVSSPLLDSNVYKPTSDFIEKSSSYPDSKSAETNLSKDVISHQIESSSSIAFIKPKSMDSTIEIKTPTETSETIEPNPPESIPDKTESSPRSLYSSKKSSDFVDTKQSIISEPKDSSASPKSLESVRLNLYKSEEPKKNDSIASTVEEPKTDADPEPAQREPSIKDINETRPIGKVSSDEEVTLDTGKIPYDGKITAQLASVISDNPFDDETSGSEEEASIRTTEIPPCSGAGVDNVVKMDVEDEAKEETSQSEYPDELNPFGSDGEDETKPLPPPTPSIKTTLAPEEAKEEPDVAKENDPQRKIIRPLNPFESDDDNDAEGEEVLKDQQMTKMKKSLNPFFSDEDMSDNDLPLKAKVKPPRPPPPTLKRDAHLIASPRKLILPGSPFDSKPRGGTAPPSPSPSTRSSSSDQSTLRLKKKLRLAPAPPSAESSPIREKDPRSAGGNPLSLNQSEDQSNDDALTTKMQKDLKNHTNKMRGDAYQRDALLSSSVKNSIQMPKSERGEWRRKKGPAPTRPVPHKRTIRKLPMRQVQQELHDIEVKQTELERQGVLLETAIRDKTERVSVSSPSPDDSNSFQSISTNSEAEKSCSSIASSTTSSNSPQGIEVEDMILQLFELVNEKNELFRRQTELMYMKREKRLEEEYAELEYQIRCLMLKPSSEKDEEDAKQEEELIARLVKTVEQRDAVVNCLEMERQREAIEDESIATHMIKYQEKHIEGIESDDKKEDTKKKKKKIRLLKKKKKGKEKEKVTKIDADKDVDETEIKKKKKKKKNWFKKSSDLPEHKT